VLVIASAPLWIVVHSASFLQIAAWFDLLADLETEERRSDGALCLCDKKDTLQVEFRYCVQSRTV